MSCVNFGNNDDIEIIAYFRTCDVNIGRSWQQINNTHEINTALEDFPKNVLFKTRP